MDIDKAGRVRSYVHTQLPFVPSYGTDILGPVESLPEAFDLKTPILTARNPLLTIRPEVQGSRGAPTQADPTLTKKSTEIRKKRSAEHPIGAEEREQSLMLKRHTRTTSDSAPSSEPAEEHTPVKRQRRRRREKPSLPTSLLFLHGFTPKNVGSSRLTIPVGGKGVFGKGKSSSAAARIPLPDLPERTSFYDEPEFIATGPQSPSTSSSRGLDLGELSHHGKQKHTPKLNEEIAEDVRSQQEQTEGAPDNRSTIWDIELEDGNILSDSSSFAWGTTVVIDTERIWNQQKGLEQPPQMVMDSCGQPQSLATRSPGEYSRSSPRVTSRFFSKCVSGLREDGSTPGTPTPDWGGHSGDEFEVPDWDDYHCTDVGRGRGSSQEADSPSGSCCRTRLSSLADKVHQGVVLGRNMRSFGTSLIESANPEDDDFPVSDSSLEAGYEMFSDLDLPERVHCFFEGRKLLLGV